MSNSDIERENKFKAWLDMKYCVLSLTSLEISLLEDGFHAGFESAKQESDNQWSAIFSKVMTYLKEKLKSLGDHEAELLLIECEKSVDKSAKQDGWIKCSDQSVPDIPVGTEREFSVFVKNSLGKTRVTTAWYLNQSELYNEDGSEEDGYDEEGMRKETGWFVLLNRHDEGMYVECDDEILMFQPLPQPPKEQS